MRLPFLASLTTSSESRISLGDDLGNALDAHNNYTKWAASLFACAVTCGSCSMSTDVHPEAVRTSCCKRSTSSPQSSDNARTSPPVSSSMARPTGYRAASVAAPTCNAAFGTTAAAQPADRESEQVRRHRLSVQRLWAAECPARRYP